MVIKRAILFFYLIILAIALLINSSFVLGVSSCKDITCNVGKTCKISDEGNAYCTGYLNINENGKSAIYTYGSCLKNKPNYLDLNGKIQENYCFGSDKVVGTEDDCGCINQFKCQSNGKCEKICSDGTAVNSCSTKKPYYCDNGTLIYNADKCSCPTGTESSASGKCLPKKEIVAYSANEFTNGEFSSMKMSSYSFINLAKNKPVSLISSSCSNPYFLTDSYSSVYKTSIFLFNEMYCKIPNTGEIYTINFGSSQSFNRIELNFGYPYIIDYNLEYYDDIHQTWKLLSSGHNEFLFNDYDFDIELYTPPEPFLIPDEGYIKFYRDLSTDNINDLLVKQEANYDDVKYEVIHKSVTFPLVSSSKIRFIPLNWQQDAKIYEIGVYNHDNELVLDKVPPVNQGQTQFKGAGSFISEPIYLNVTPSEMRYTDLKFNVGNQIINNNINSIENLTPNATFFYYDSNQGYDYDEGYRYYGLGGSSPFNLITTGSYPSAGYSTIYYSKYCLNDSKSIGQTSPVVSNNYCVMHPAIMDNLTDFYNDVIDSNGFKKGNAIGGANTTSFGIGGSRAGTFDGIDDYVYLGDPITEGLNSFSISFWINKTTTNLPSFRPILTKGNLGNINMLLAISINGSNSVRFELSNSTSIYSIISDSSPDSQWTHLVVTYDDASKNIGLYRDGLLVNSLNLPNSFSLNRNNNDSLRLASNALISSFFKGSIDELMIFSSALSSDRVFNLYTDQKNNESFSMIDNVHYWKFNEQSWKVSNEQGKSGMFFGAYFEDKENTINRIVLDELVNRIESISLVGVDGTDYDIWSKIYLNPNNSVNTRTIIDIPQTTSQEFILYIRTKKNQTLDLSSPLIWEMHLMNVHRGSASVATPNYYVGFQIRTGSSKQDLASSDWYGPNGVKNTYFISSGQSIGKIHNGKPWVQYMVILNTSNQNYSPTVDNISIGYVGGESLKPIAEIESKHSAKIGENVVFSGAGSINPDGKIVSYRWDFGDGAVAQGTVVSHSYNSAGDKRIVLTVLDSENQIARVEGKVSVSIYDCLSPDTFGTSNPVIFPMDDPVISQTASQALREYADRKKISISDIDSVEEKMEASLEFIQNHMSYRSDDENKKAVESAGVNYLPPASQYGDYPMSLPIAVKYTSLNGCTLDSEFCGDCEDFSIMFTTLARSMGVNSKCVYSASGLLDVGHVYNVINYQGKWRILEPQQNSLTENLYSNSLSWNKSNMPYYFVDAVFNDKSNNYVDIYNKTAIENADITMGLIQNNMGANGYPNSSDKCINSSYTKYLAQRNTFNGGNPSKWDPISLFKDVC